jgi:hypothetical protein
LLNHNLRIIFIIFNGFIPFSTLLSFLNLIYFISIVTFSFTPLLFNSWLREFRIVGLNVCWLDRLAIIERVDASRDLAILSHWGRVAFRTIAALFILFTLLIDGSTETFVGNSVLGAMINRKFFLLSLQSFFKILTILLK